MWDQVRAASFASFVEVVRLRAARQPTEVAYRFLLDGDEEEAVRTFAEVDEEARAVAALLERAGLSGERAILLYPPGLDFISAFFGCLFAGVVAVPCYLPRAGRSPERLEAIIGDAQPSAILTAARLLEQLRARYPWKSALRWLATDEAKRAEADYWEPPSLRPDTLACLQYTSGSTARPRGVMLSHGNLLFNSQFISEAFAHQADTVGVSWLPPYHDMGLIGGILQPLFAGIPVVLLSPVHVVQRPVRWLRAITRYRGTISGGPNFIYDLCASGIHPEERSSLELSSWEVAFNGAEPIHHGTLERFAEAFRPCGFKKEAFLPCYGLAEATLIVSGGVKGSGPMERTVSREALEARQEFSPCRSAEDARLVVGCGRPAAGLRVLIRDPQTGDACARDRVGEIWVSGPSVASGYWGRPEESTGVFRATIEGRERGSDETYLRTGDLGLLDDGQLFVTGRLKDLIIIDGRNHYPQDIERTVERSHPALGAHGGAAFTALCESERLVVVQELERHARNASLEDIFAAIRGAVAEEHGISVSGIVLVRRGAVPRTSSGKVQRRLCRERFLAGELTIVGAWLSEDVAGLRRVEETSEAAIEPASGPAGATVPPLASPRDRTGTCESEAIRDWLISRVAELIRFRPEDIDVRRPLAAYGLNSRDAIQLSGELERRLARPLMPTLVYDYPTIESLSRHLAGKMEETPAAAWAEETADPRRPGECAISEPIAIVGMGCRLPGASNPAAFWRMLTEGLDAVRQVPPDRWHAGPNDPKNISWGGFLEGIDQFDAAFFGISPREAAYIDPQHRLLMEVTWEALEDAGQPLERLRGSSTGVFAGISTNDYGHLVSSQASELDPYWTTGNAGCLAANRLSYFFDFHGPSVAVDTACSSSLVAVHLACRSLLSRECDMAVACGVNLILSPEISISFAKAGGFAPDGCCKAFDARANGIVRSEGAGSVVLKRLSRALADGDRIYAVIRGGAVNQDGRSNGITAPNQDAQERLLREAYRAAGVSPGDVQYVEAHGAGTLLGDVIEAGALNAVLSVGRAHGKRCALGSVKTNIGHCEAAAGIAGLIKVALSLAHGQIPATLHFREPNPHIAFAEMPFYVHDMLSDWEAENGRRLAGVSSFGFGGTNAHLILESPPGEKPACLPPEPSAEGVRLLPLSAASPSALGDIAAGIEECLVKEAIGRDCLPDLCHLAGVRRSHLDHRAAIRFRDREELLKGLQALRDGKHDPSVTTGAVGHQGRSKLVFVFSGHGSQWWGMGRQLLERTDAFRTSIERCDEAIRQHAGWSLMAEMTVEPSQSRLESANLEIAQTCLFACQWALAEVWKSWGIHPDAVVGHSMGEVAAACLGGALGLDDAVRLMVHRTRLLQAALDETPPGGGMAAVRVSAEEAAELLRGYEDQVSVAVYNSPRYTVLSGPLATLERLIESLRTKKVGGRVMNVPGAAHTAALEPMRIRLENQLSDLKPRRTTIPFYSTVTGGVLPGTELNAAYWGRNLRQPVQFAPAIYQLIEDDYRFFLELSPHPLLNAAVQQCLAHREREAVVLPSLRREEDELETMLGSLAALYVQGRSVDWARLYPACRCWIPLPSYPWQRERHWIERKRPDLRAGGNGKVVHGPEGSRHAHPLVSSTGLSPAVVSGLRCWEAVLSTRRVPYLADHRLQGRPVLPVAAYLETALAASRQVLGDGPLDVEDLSLHQTLIVPEEDETQVQVVTEPDGPDAVRFKFFSRRLEDSQPDAWRLHAACRVVRLKEDASKHPEDGRSLEDVRTNCPEALDCRTHYERIKQKGADFGPSFSGMSQLWRGEYEAVGRVTTPSSLAGDAGRYRIHPALLDGCMQVMSAACQWDEKAWDDHAIYMPVAVAGLRLHAGAEVNGTLWSHATVRLFDGDDSSAIDGDIRVWNESGEPILEVSGLRLRRLQAREASAVVPSADHWLYGLRWEERPLSQDRILDSTAARTHGRWVLFVAQHGLGDGITRRLADCGAKCVTVRPGESFQRLGPDCFTLNPANPQDFRDLFAWLHEDSSPPICGVVHLWGLDIAGCPATLDLLASAETLLYASTLHLVQSLGKSERSWPPRLWIVTERAQSLAGSAEVCVAQTPLWGIGRVIQREHPDLRCTLIDVANAGADHEAALARELLAGDREDQIALHNGSRYVARLAALDESLGSARDGQAVFAADATYLIAGGLGGLGLSTAQWMVERGVRHLVLMGRRGVRPEVEGALAAMRTAGAEVVVAQGDLVERHDLEKIIERIRQSMPPLRGVIHSATTLDDALLMEMDAHQLLSVMRPKTLGAWNLHELTLDSPLDFFVCFSSAASFLGPPGGANYAAGNLFLDGLALYRRGIGRPALAINWGPWANVGIAAKSEYGRRINLQGFRMISPEQGLAVLDHLLLRRDLTQAAVLPVDWTELRNAYPVSTKTPLLEKVMADFARPDGPAEAPSAILETLKNSPPDLRRERLQDYLRTQLAGTLGMAPERIDVQQPLTNMGIDSLMAIELKNRIEAELQIAVRIVDFLAGPTIAGLSTIIMEQLGAGDHGASDGSRAPGAGRLATHTHRVLADGDRRGLLETLDQLPDAEVDTLLREMLAERK